MSQKGIPVANASEAGDLAEKLAKAWRFFYDCCFIEGFGHIGARTSDPCLILISPFSLGPRAKAEDFVIVDLNGVQHGTSASLPGETPIHLEIYKTRQDVGSIGHFHAIYPTSFCMSDLPMLPTYFLASIFKDGIPIHLDSRLIITAERAKALAMTLGSHRAAIMKAHGIVTVAQDLEEMLAVTYILEDNARRAFVSASMGKVEHMSDEAMAEIEPELLKNRGPFRRIWSLCECHAQSHFLCDPVRKGTEA